MKKKLEINWPSASILIVCVVLLALIFYTQGEEAARALLPVFLALTCGAQAFSPPIARATEVESDETKRKREIAEAVRDAFVGAQYVPPQDLEADDDSQEITRPSYYSEEAKNGRANTSGHQQLRDPIRSGIRPGTASERVRGERSTDSR
jgi:hypothetical protein